MQREAVELPFISSWQKNSMKGWLYFSQLNSLFLRLETFIIIISCFSDASVEECWCELTVPVTINWKKNSNQTKKTGNLDVNKDK